MKTCSKCEQLLSLDNFSKKKNSLQPWCKQCCKKQSKIYNKQYYQNNIELCKKNNNQYYQLNTELIKQQVNKIQNSIDAGVYMIKCLINGKRYIGQSVKPYRRKTEHFTKHQSSKSYAYNQNICNDLKQYGKQSFVFGIIEHCSPEQLLEREQYYINLFKPEYNEYHA